MEDPPQIFHFVITTETSSNSSNAYYALQKKKFEYMRQLYQPTEDTDPTSLIHVED